ncbi:hypothetical protein GE21DRAFT_1285683 [Neurospora crassa]|nr:hypothetical protein GE21DRAFT_1285683 [Neurospora crassa]
MITLSISIIPFLPFLLLLIVILASIHLFQACSTLLFLPFPNPPYLSPPSAFFPLPNPPSFLRLLSSCIRHSSNPPLAQLHRQP